MPLRVKPMLTTLVDEAFDNDDWLFEIKWDGYRAVASISGGTVELYSRNNLSFNLRYPEIVDELRTWPIDAVLDGEIVALDENGHSRFQFLQNWMSDQQGTLRYYVFDILWLEGYDLTQVPLIDRKKILKQVLPGGDSIFYSDHLEKNGTKFFEVASEKGLEGIIAKREKRSL
jgi:bifunctional non-homologous end joining protein LigD